MTAQVDGGATQEFTGLGAGGDHRQRDLLALDVQPCLDFAETGPRQVEAGLPAFSAVATSVFAPVARVVDLPLDFLAGPDLSLPGKILRREGLELLLDERLRLLRNRLGGLRRL